MEISLLTIKEYAAKKHVSYEAVRKQIQKYKNNELKDHIVRKNKTQFLDDYAIDFLDNRRRESPVMLYQENRDEELERLREDNQRLLAELNGAKSRIISQQDRLYELTVSEQKMLLLEATTKAAEERAAAAEQKAAASEKQAVTAVQRKMEAELALEEIRERAETAEQIAEAAGQEADRLKGEKNAAEARAAAADEEVDRLRAELEAMKKRGLWARILNK